MGHLILWAAFTVGQILNMLTQAYNVVKDKGNTVDSYKHFFGFFFVPLIVRYFLCLAIFLLWATSPDFMQSAMAKFGWSTDVKVPIVGATALIFGFLCDYVLDLIVKKIPFLGKRIPTLEEADETKPSN